MPSHRDQDYTYGLSLSYTGRNARDAWYSLNPALGALDRLFGVDGRAPERIDGHSVEFGLFGFTPEDKAVSTPVYNDRPYASLIYLSQSRVRIDPRENVAWHSSLTLGALGLAIVGNGQNAVHKVIGTEHAEGWRHQVSEGGEPTARYTVARQKYLAVSSPNLEVKSTVQASAGYLTEARWSLSFRGGRLAAPGGGSIRSWPVTVTARHAATAGRRGRKAICGVVPPWWRGATTFFFRASSATARSPTIPIS